MGSASNYEFFKKNEALYNMKNRLSKTKKLRLSILSKPFLKDLNVNIGVTNLAYFGEEMFPNPNLIVTKNFNFPISEVNIDLMEDSYENIKYLNYAYLLSTKNILNTQQN